MPKIVFWAKLIVFGTFVWILGKFLAHCSLFCQQRHFGCKVISIWWLPWPIVMGFCWLQGFFYAELFCSIGLSRNLLAHFILAFFTDFQRFLLFPIEKNKYYPFSLVNFGLISQTTHVNSGSEFLTKKRANFIIDPHTWNVCEINAKPSTIKSLHCFWKTVVKFTQNHWKSEFLDDDSFSFLTLLDGFLTISHLVSLSYISSYFFTLL